MNPSIPNAQTRRRARRLAGGSRDSGKSVSPTQVRELARCADVLGRQAVVPETAYLAQIEIARLHQLMENTTPPKP